jgi:trehalose/maltose hydrolase-like predicted phosphorylase
VAWAAREESRIEILGNLGLAQAINASLYYLRSSIRLDWPWSLSPGGLATNGYNGHTFWDAETWMYPAFLLLEQDTAQAVLEYRSNLRGGAEEKAESNGYAGMMFPWESAFTGEEVCPDVGGTCLYEVHITGDIAFALAQFWWASGDVAWLAEVDRPHCRLPSHCLLAHRPTGRPEPALIKTVHGVSTM